MGSPRGPTEARSDGHHEGGGRQVVGWEEERVGECRVAASPEGLRRGVVGRSREVARCGEVRTGCACGTTGRGRASVRHGGSRWCGGRRTPARSVRSTTRVWVGPDPVCGPTSTSPLERGSGGGGGDGGGRHAARGPGRTPLLVVIAGRAGTPRHATRWLCGARGFRGWKGRGPSDVDSTPTGAPPKYPDPGQQGNDMSESQGDRIWSGAGFFPCGFANPPTSCLNFSLWRDLSLCGIWGGYSGRWRSGWGGVY